MAIFVPQQNVKNNLSFGQAINKVRKEYINPEIKGRNLDNFRVAGIEILTGGKHKIYLDNEVEITLDFKKDKIKPEDVGAKPINIDLHEIKDVSWNDKKINKNSAKILVIHFNKDWWI